MNVTSVSWNSEMDDLIAYASNDMFFIQLINNQPQIQKLEGNVVGFKGSKLFIYNKNITTIDVSQT